MIVSNIVESGEISWSISKCSSSGTLDSGSPELPKLPA